MRGGKPHRLAAGTQQRLAQCAEQSTGGTTTHAGTRQKGATKQRAEHSANKPPLVERSCLVTPTCGAQTRGSGCTCSWLLVTPTCRAQTRGRKRLHVSAGHAHSWSAGFWPRSLVERGFPVTPTCGSGAQTRGRKRLHVSAGHAHSWSAGFWPRAQDFGHAHLWRVNSRKRMHVSTGHACLGCEPP